LDKIDIADYMKDHSPEDFKGLIESSVRLWDFKLNQQVTPASTTSLEKLSAFKSFISNDLHGMISEEWNVFVNNEVPEKFRLKLKDVSDTITDVRKAMYKIQASAAVQPDEHGGKPENHDTDLDEMDISDEEKEAARLKAIDILKNETFYYFLVLY
jgi:hypothetical protein